MDGSVSLLDAETGRLLHSAKAHLKYVVSMAWGGDGRRFVSASWDATVAVHTTVAAASAQSGCHADEAAAGAGEVARVAAAAGGSENVCGFETLKVFRYAAQVQAAVFLADGDTVVVAVRDSNYLRLVSAASLEVGAAPL